MNVFKLIKLNLYILAIYTTVLGVLLNSGETSINQISDNPLLIISASVFVVNIILLTELYIGSLNVSPENEFYKYGVKDTKIQKTYLILCFILIILQIFLFTGSLLNIDIIELIIILLVLLVIGTALVGILLRFIGSDENNGIYCDKGYH